MKSFSYRVFFFLIIPIIIVFFLDQFFLRDQNTLFKEKYNGALKNKDSIAIVVLGNSHANYAVNPTAFDLYTYNLANLGQSIYFDKRITTSLMKNIKNLKYVLISIDYHSLYFSTQGVQNNWSYYANGIKYKDSNYILADISPTLFGYTFRISISLLKKKIENEIKYGGNCIDFDVENGVNRKDSIVKGFIAYEGNQESAFTSQSYKSRINGFNTTIINSKEKDEILIDLDDFLKILLTNNITPILFTSPTYTEYNKYLDKTIKKNNFEEVQKLCIKYNIKYWDFMDDKSFERKDFYDGDHLNKEGAYKFSLILNDSINSLELRKYHNGKSCE